VTQSNPIAAASDRDRYAGYENWKNWTKPFQPPAGQVAYFEGECRDLNIAYADVFEIGFGEGLFLAWAKGRGARVFGAEINAAMKVEAEKFGVALLPADFEIVASDHAARFDTIAAFDVYEHLSFDALSAKLRACESMLKPGGRLILRFPNGQSPFGLPTQHGDPTHILALSHAVLEPLIKSTGFEVVRYGPAYRVAGPTPFKWLAYRLRYALRDAIAGVLNFAYGQSIPWDPVVVLVLRKGAP